jgi:hypothetical protein
VRARQAAQSTGTVIPVAITCEWPGGDAGKEAAYWGDRTILPQLWNLLCYREVRMTVWFGDPVPTAASRKVLAARLRGQVEHRIIRTQDLTRMPLSGP